MLQLEEDSIRAMCQDIIAFKPDVVVTEKGISGNINKKQDLFRLFLFRCCCSLFSSCWNISSSSYEKIR
jgi:hypothetical protein